jgi:MYXO-CTERM domain-containing protein
VDAGVDAAPDAEVDAAPDAAVDAAPDATDADLVPDAEADAEPTPDATPETNDVGPPVAAAGRTLVGCRQSWSSTTPWPLLAALTLLVARRRRR